MQRNKIDFYLQNKIRNYMNFLNDEMNENADIEKNLINKLNHSLKEEIIIRVNGSILKNIPFFFNNFSEETLRKLVFIMKEVKFYPEEIIFQVSLKPNYIFKK